MAQKIKFDASMDEIRDAFNRPPRPDLLRATAGKVAAVPLNRFDQKNWCGTAKCAFGHGVTMAKVRAEGVHVHTDRHGHQSIRLNKREDNALVAYFKARGYNGGSVMLRARDPFKIAQYVYGITEKEAEKCFLAYPNSRRAVVNNLLDVANNYDPEVFD